MGDGSTFSWENRKFRLEKQMVSVWEPSENIGCDQPRSQSSAAISDVTSPVKLVGKIRLGRLANNGKSKMAASSQECDYSQDS